MVTVVNNPGGSDRVVERSDSSGWAVAVIILIALVAVGGFFAWRYYRAPAAAPAQSNGGANINVTVPTPGGGGENTAPAE